MEPEDPKTLLRAYWREQSERTLPVGKLTGWLGVTTLPAFMIQDIFFVQTGWATLFRLLGIAASILFLVKAHTTFRHDVRKVIHYHSLVLVMLMVQICGLTYVLWRNGSATSHYEVGTTQGITVVTLVVFLLAKGARRFLPLITGIPFGILAILMLTTANRPLGDLALFTNPGIVVVVVALYSRSREKVTFSEFSMRRLASRHEEELELSAKRLARTNAELRGFAYTASHDLQQPLRSISGFLDLIRDELSGAGVLKDTVADHFSRVTGAAQRMSELVDALLAYSRATSRDAVFVNVDLDQVLDDVKSDLSSAIQSSNATIDSTPLPQVRGDIHQLASVLQNLITNSIKYAKDDEAPLIRIRAIDEEDSVRISITDNGIGFDPENASALFEAFKRLHKSGEFEGVGLGLAICRKYVEGHGGEIGAPGARGGGPTFWFTLAKDPDGAGQG